VIMRKDSYFSYFAVDVFVILFAFIFHTCLLFDWLVASDISGIYIQGVSKPMSQTFPGYSPPPLKQKRSYQHGSKSEQVSRYPLVCRNPRNDVINKKHPTRQYLNDHFPGNWIGRNGPVAWPLVPRISILSISTFGATLKMKFTPHPLPTLTSYGNAT
jgi:hypothetical protein